MLRHDGLMDLAQLLVEEGDLLAKHQDGLEDEVRVIVTVVGRFNRLVPRLLGPCIPSHGALGTTVHYYAQRIVMWSRFRKCLLVRSSPLDYCT